MGTNDGQAFRIGVLSCIKCPFTKNYICLAVPVIPPTAHLAKIIEHNYCVKVISGQKK